MRKAFDIVSRITVKNIRLRKSISWLLILTIIAYLINRIYADWELVEKALSKVEFKNAIFIFILFFLHSLLNIKGWQLILRDLGHRLAYHQCMKIWTFSQVGRYLPGKVWMILGRIYLAEKAGVNVITSCCSIYLELAAVSVAALILGSLSLLQPNFSLPSNYDPLIYMAVGVLLILVHPKILEKSINFGLRIFRKPNISVPASFTSILKFVAFYTIAWQLSGFAIFVLVSHFTSISLYRVPLFSGTIAIAWIIGLVSVFSPSGLGVREGVLTFLLSHFVPTPIAATIALLSRILYIMTDLSLFFLAFLVKSSSKDILSRGET